MLKASRRSTYFSGGGAFLACPYHPFRYLFLTVVPNSGNVKSWFDSFFLPTQMKLVYYDAYNTNYLFMGGILICVTVFVFWIVMMKRTDTDQFYLAMDIACLMAVLFWVLYIGGEAFILASILSHVPVIKGFRYLYKAIYVIPALLILPASIGLNKVSGFKVKWKIIIYGACLLCLAEQIHECRSAIVGAYNEYSYEYLSNIKEFDTNNYRVLFVTSDEDIHEYIDYMPYANANANVTALIQTVGGFELTCGELPESMTALYAGTEWVGLSGSNAVRISELMDWFEMDEKNPDEFMQALNDNSVGYIMTRDSNLDSLFHIMREYGYSTRKIYHNDQNLVEIYKIDNIMPIASDENGNLINITQVGLDNINIVVGDGIQKINLKIRYNKNLHAYFTDVNGKQREVSVEQGANGIVVDSSVSNGILNIRYENAIYSIGILLAVIYLPAISGVIIYAFVKTKAQNIYLL